MQAAIERCERLLRDEAPDRAGQANVRVFLGGLEAQRGRFLRARRLIADARRTYDELGQSTVAATHCGAILGDVELLAGNVAAATTILREVCDSLERTGESAHLASRAADLADALYTQGYLAEAEKWSRVSEEHAGADDLDAQFSWRAVRAKLAARHGAFEHAEALVAEAARVAAPTEPSTSRRRSAATTPRSCAWPAAPPRPP